MQMIPTNNREKLKRALKNKLKTDGVYYLASILNKFPEYRIYTPLHIMENFVLKYEEDNVYIQEGTDHKIHL